MTPEQLFAIANTVALVTWLLLALFPGQRLVARLVAGAAVPGLLAVVYVSLLVTHWGGPGGFATLGDVARLFSNPWLLLAGWVHYLAFDLLVGVWEITDARERGVPHLLVVPCLFLTFMFGPAGWMLYQGIRQVRGVRPVTSGGRS